MAVPGCYLTLHKRTGLHISGKDKNSKHAFYFICVAFTLLYSWKLISRIINWGPSILEVYRTVRKWIASIYYQFIVQSHNFLLCSRGCTYDCHFFGEDCLYVTTTPSLVFSSNHTFQVHLLLPHSGTECLLWSLFQAFSVHRARMCYYVFAFNTYKHLHLSVLRDIKYIYIQIDTSVFIYKYQRTQMYLPLLTSSPTPKVHAHFLISFPKSEKCPPGSLQPIAAHSQCCSLALHRRYLILTHHTQCLRAAALLGPHTNLWVEQRGEWALPWH